MFRPKHLIAVLGVSLAVVASMSSQACAASAGWMVNGTRLTGTAALAGTAAVEQEFEATAGQVKVNCGGKALIYINPKLNGTTNMVDIEAAEFTHCLGNATCPLATSMKEAVRTLPVLADVTLDGALAVKGVFLPVNSAKLFATLAFEGSECSFSGVSGVSGQQAFLTATGQDEGVSRLLTAVTETAGELKLASTSASLKGSVLARLASNQSFSFL